jgi:hypothetical protein
LPDLFQIKILLSFTELLSMRLLMLVLGLFISLGCTKVPEDEAAASSSGRYLYVSSGICYAGGGNTTFTNLTSSNLVTRINLENGTRDRIIADYNASPAVVGDSPVGIVNVDDNYIYVLVENSTTTSARRIEKVEKKTNGARTAFSNNVTAMSAALRSLAKTSNGDLLISKSTGIEKITSGNVRITQGANAFIQSPAGSCATSATLHSKVLSLPGGKVVFFHATANQNRFGIISASGYASGADCLGAQASPVPATAYPVAAAFDETNSNLIVAWSGNSTATSVNSIWYYPINLTTNVISAGVKIYDASLWPATYPYLLYGMTDMYLDSTTNSLYVATAIATTTAITSFAIEKFTYDPSQAATSVLTRVGSVPFYQYGLDTKCITSMMIAN